MKKINVGLMAIALASSLWYTPAQAERTFVHPGGVLTQTDFERIINNYRQSPWNTGWQLLINYTDSKSSYTADPRTNLGNPDGAGNNRQRASRDATAAFLNILEWRITGDKAYADCAARIFTAWGNTVQECRGQLYQFPITELAIAAEMLRNADGSWYSGWREEDRNTFLNMLRTICYPACHDFIQNTLCTHPSWDAPAADAIMAMSIILDDEDMFNEAVEYYKGETTTYFPGVKDYIGWGSVFGTILNESGQVQEMARDISHSVLGLSSLAQMCQMAWNQGVDLYSFADNRLLKGYEYFCQYELNHEMEYEPFSNCDGYTFYYISTHNNGRRLYDSPTYEMVYNHYVVRQGLDAPWLSKFAKLARPELISSGFEGLGTLLYTLDAERSPLMTTVPDKPTDVIATPGLGQVRLSWTAPEGDVASGHVIYRKGGSASTYSVIYTYSKVTSTEYVDKDVTPGTAYTYRVKAVNYAGTSAFSAASATVTPEAGSTELPTGWKFSDVGTPNVAGSGLCAQVGDTMMSVTGAGYDIGSAADSYGYLYQQVKGDATLTCRVLADGAGKAGIIACDDLDGKSRRMAVLLNDRYSRLAMRYSDGGGTTWRAGNSFTYAPFWFKLVRTGSLFKAYQSRDGKVWHEMGRENISMADTYYIGLGSSSCNRDASEAIQTALYDHVTIKPYAEVISALQEVPVAERLKAYPNPVRDFLTVVIPGGEEGLFARLYDMQGQLRMERHTHSGDRLDLRNMDRGMYLLTVGNGDDYQTNRILIEH